jgi:hypothetical protein
LEVVGVIANTNLAIDPKDESLWAKAEYPFMQDAGTITKMKDDAKKPEDVDFQIDPPAKAVC